MTDEVSVYLRGAAQQLYRAALELVSRAGSGEEVSVKELRESAAALRELMALRDMTAPSEADAGIRVIFEGGEEAWSQ